MSCLVSPPSHERRLSRVNSFAATHPWKTKVSSLATDSWPMKMSFHSFEDHLAISDENDQIW